MKVVNVMLNTYKEIGFVIFMTKNGDDSHVNFKVVDINDCVIDDHSVKFIKNGTKEEELSRDIEDAEIFLSGFIKWDGCSNMKFDAQEKAYLLFCGRKGAKDIGKLMEKLYDLAAEMMPEYEYNFE